MPLNTRLILDLSEVESGLVMQAQAKAKTAVVGDQVTAASAVAAPPTSKFAPIEVLNGVPEGSRDESLFRLACSYRGKRYGYEEAKVLVLAAAASCTPPFPDTEALKKLDQAWKFPEATARERQSWPRLIGQKSGFDK